ncbi:MAG: hypothetical protein RIS76_4218 [Verrucomicrobiota bacterium]|jgi:hypothetical protein
MKHSIVWFLRWALVGWVLATAAGCKSNDDDLVERPWNAPKSWETGLPAGMMEGR